MEAINLRKLKRPQLIEIAAYFKIRKRHRLRKRDLIRRLEKLLPQIPEKFSLAFMKPKNVESSSRFAPTPPPPQPPFVDRGAPLPLHYGQDRVTALVRDPNSLFIYWEIEGPRRAEVVRTHGEAAVLRASWVLRLHSDADGGSTQDVPVVADGCNWYLSVAEDTAYVVEIGLKLNGGPFVSLARSNHVRTPRSGASSDTRTEWMLVEEDFRRAVKIDPSDVPRVSGKFAETLAERFRGPEFGSRFMGASGRMPGSHTVGRRADKK